MKTANRPTEIVESASQTNKHPTSGGWVRQMVYRFDSGHMAFCSQFPSGAWAWRFTDKNGDTTNPICELIAEMQALVAAAHPVVSL